MHVFTPNPLNSRSREIEYLPYRIALKFEKRNSNTIAETSIQ